jgi:hypothetical protein
MLFSITSDRFANTSFDNEDIRRINYLYVRSDETQTNNNKKTEWSNVRTQCVQLNSSCRRLPRSVLRRAALERKRKVAMRNAQLRYWI